MLTKFSKESKKPPNVKETTDMERAWVSLADRYISASQLHQGQLGETPDII